MAEGEREQYTRANLSPANTCLSFPAEFKRSKKNNISLFPALIRETVADVTVLPFERTFTIRFASGLVLLFKLHGSRDRKSTRLNSSHVKISYAVFCLKKKKQIL